MSERLQKQQLRIYTVTWCPHCIRFRAWLEENAIPHLNNDVDDDAVAWQEALALTGGVDIVPVAEVGGRAVWGPFNDEFKTRLKALLHDR